MNESISYADSMCALLHLLQGDVMTTAAWRGSVALLFPAQRHTERKTAFKTELLVKLLTDQLKNTFPSYLIYP